MGGSGSGRWSAHTPRRVVEQSFALDIRHVYGKHIPREYFQRRQRWSREYSFPFLDVIISSSSWDLTWSEDIGYLNLKQTYGHDAGQRKYQNQIQLTSTPCNYGKERWWFICPDCKRCCTCLYMVGRSYRYSCRKCWSLGYRSIREAHKSDRGAKILGMDLSILDWHIKCENLVERWYKKEHLTKAERRAIAKYFGVPVFMIRNKFYKRSTRLKMLASSARANVTT